MKPCDLQFIYLDIQKEMSQHYQNTCKIPQSFGQDMPKDLKEFSHRNQERFLNKHQNKIEEAKFAKILPKNIYLWYVGQNLIHIESEILNHDNFFKAGLRDYLKYIAYSHKSHILNGGFNFHNVGLVGRLVNANPGVDITTPNVTDSTHAGIDNTFITGNKLNAGVVGKEYNRAASRLHTLAGDMKQGVYQETSSVPSTLYGSHGAVTPSAEFEWFSLTTTITLVQTTVWHAHKFSNNGLATYYVDGTGNRAYKGSQSFAAAMPDPFPASPTTDAYPNQAKIGYG